MVQGCDGAKSTLSLVENAEDGDEAQRTADALLGVLAEADELLSTWLRCGTSIETIDAQLRAVSPIASRLSRAVDDYAAHHDYDWGNEAYQYVKTRFNAAVIPPTTADQINYLQTGVRRLRGEIGAAKATAELARLRDASEPSGD